MKNQIDTYQNVAFTPLYYWRPLLLKSFGVNDSN